MLETSAIDSFLRKSLRQIRAGDTAPWPVAWTSQPGSLGVWERIEFQGVALLFHAASGKLQDWPQQLLDRIGEEARLMALWEATHRRALAKLIEALASQDIDSVLMKGTAIAYSLYDDPAARRRGDSDLLVQPEDMDRVRSVLEECGWYRNDDPHGLTHQEGWLFDSAGAFTHALDLHWETSDRPAICSVLPRADLFASRQQLPALCPAAERAEIPLILIHEAINQKWHETRGYWTDQGRIKGARRLIWSVDFDLMANAMTDNEWQRLIELCAKHGIGPLILEALKNAQDDLEIRLPSEPLCELASQPHKPEIMEYFAASDDFDEFLLKLRDAPGWKARIDLVLDRGFPPPQHLRSKYPQQASWPTAALQARLLMEAAGRMIRRVAAR